MFTRWRGGRAVALPGLVVLSAACRSAQPSGEPPVPDIPSPVHRTPTITLPPATVSRPASTGELLRAIVDSVAQSPMWSTARHGMLVLDVTSGDTLLSHDADKFFLPASNQKLLTAAVALTVLGGGFRWQTPVLLDGRLQGSTFDGNLVLVGSGDPSWSDSLHGGDALRVFAPIVDALRARGIRRITGGVVAAGDVFPGRTTGSGWEIDDLDGVYGAPVDELLLNEGALQLRVSGGVRIGAPLVVRRTPTARYPRVVVQGTTVAGSPGNRLRVVYDSTGSHILVTGTLAVGEQQTFALPYRHPNDAVRAALAEHLITAGITIDTNLARPVATPPTTDGVPVERLLPRGDTLVVLQSAALDAILARMQKASQNQIAELLFRTAGLVATGSGNADSARVAAVRTLGTMGVDAAALAFRDGSGMSRHNFVTPGAIVRVLERMHHSPFAAMYRDALPIAGVDGTLQNRMRGTVAANTVRAKTGTLDKARSLSGYVTTADGRVLAFALLANNYTTPSRDVDRLHELILTTLAAARVGEQ